MQGDKNSISKIYEDIHRSRLCSAHLKASSGPRTKVVPTNNQMGQYIELLLRTRTMIIRHRVEATLRQPQIKQDTASKKGERLQNQRKHHIILTKYEAVHSTAGVETYCSSWMPRILIKRKRTRSDSVLWQKTLFHPKKKSQNTTQTSITQRLRTNLERLVGVTNAIQFVSLNRFTGSQPSY